MPDELNALAGAYALDALTEDERELFEVHLESCAECAEEVRGMQNVAGELSYLDATAPPVQVRIEVLDAISRTRPLAPISSNVISMNHRRRSYRAAQFLAAACTLIAVIAGGWAYQEHHDAANARKALTSYAAAAAAPDSKSVTGELGANSGITATVVYSKDDGAMVMNAHGVATLASDKTYQAWAITTGGRAISLGTFTPDSSGDVTMLGKTNLTDVTSLGVTVEPAGGSSAPTGKVAALSL